MTMKEHRTISESGRKAGTLAIVFGCAVVVGCASSTPPPPPVAPAPQALTISPQRKQSQAQQGRDSGECQSQAAAQAATSQDWVVIFTSCMSGRGYLVQ